MCKLGIAHHTRRAKIKACVAGASKVPLGGAEGQLAGVVRGMPSAIEGTSKMQTASGTFSTVSNAST